MDYGRLASLEGVDFRFPADDPANAGRVAQAVAGRDAAPARPAQLFCGPPIWNHVGFAGKVYPTGSRRSEFLRHFSEAFNSIELNPTYYGVDVLKLQSWARQVRPGFVFAPKFPRQATHDAMLEGVERETEAFYAAVRQLGAALGPLFAVLHPRFEPQHLPRLQRLLASLPDDLEAAIEFRHPKWFSDAGAWREAIALLRQTRAMTVITDSAGRRDAVHQSLSTTAVFIRFLANNLHPTDALRVERWIIRLSEWIEIGLKRIYFYVHQPSEPLAVELIEQLIRGLGQRFGPQRLQLPKLPPRYDEGEQRLLF
ncbi:MAG: DUF72 domain-containing protein [Leptospirales bacterium]|nr:DUF72 domain-containing protein [Leptospirales bacterium]